MVSLAFYFFVGMVLLTAAVLLSFASEVYGISPRLQHLARVLFHVRALPLGPVPVAEVTVAAASVLALAGTAMNLAATLLFNRITGSAGRFRLQVAATDPVVQEPLCWGQPRAAFQKFIPPSDRSTEAQENPLRSHADPLRSC